MLTILALFAMQHLDDEIVEKQLMLRVREPAQPSNIKQHTAQYSLSVVSTSMRLITLASVLPPLLSTPQTLRL